MFQYQKIKMKLSLDIYNIWNRQVIKNLKNYLISMSQQIKWKWWIGNLIRLYFLN